MQRGGIKEKQKMKNKNKNSLLYYIKISLSYSSFLVCESFLVKKAVMVMVMVMVRFGKAIREAIRVPDFYYTTNNQGF